MFINCRIPKPFVSVSELPAALRRPQKNICPGILEHVSCGFCNFLTISGSHSPVRLCRSCLRRFGDLRKKHTLDFVSMYFICVVLFKRFQCPLVTNSKYGRSDQMTMPGRRASKFSAKRRALLLPFV